MTKTHKDYLLTFKTPAGIAVIINVIILMGNMLFASQLLPLTNTLNLLSQRIEVLERRFDNQEAVIIPRAVLDEKFKNIELQLVQLNNNFQSNNSANFK